MLSAGELPTRCVVTENTPEQSESLQNSQFNLPGPARGSPVLGWRPFGGGYVHDPSGGRIAYGSRMPTP